MMTISFRSVSVVTALWLGAALSGMALCGTLGCQQATTPTPQPTPSTTQTPIRENSSATPVASSLPVPNSTPDLPASPVASAEPAAAASPAEPIPAEVAAEPAPAVISIAPEAAPTTTAPPKSTQSSPPKLAPVSSAPDLKWQRLFDGLTLGHWKSVEFGGEGEVTVDDGSIVMQRGSEISGIRWTGDPLPKVNYEIAFDARRIEGSDFFCGVIFPVDTSSCSFVVGGWGGGVVGLSSVDGLYAADNDTASYATFKEKQWYRVRLRVGENYIRAWIDEQRVVNLDRTNRKVSVHPAVELAKPLGITCYATVAGLADIQIRALSASESQGESTPPPPFEPTAPEGR